jgi:DNA-directed RNA polymerase specialized sigma24 family protein
VARRFTFRSANDRRDAESDTLLAAIQRIDRFKFDRGTDAFAYYTSLVWNAMGRQLAGRRRQQSRAALFTDVDLAPHKAETIRLDALRNAR